MTILYKKAQQGTSTSQADMKANIMLKKPELTPNEQAAIKKQYSAPASAIVTQDIADAQDYQRQAYAALSRGFKQKYPDLDYKGVQSTINEINPNYRPEWKARADSFAKTMIDKHGDYSLSPEEVNKTLIDAGLDSQRYVDSYKTIGDRYATSGVTVPHKGTKEDSISSWGWRSLSSPIYSVKEGEDRYQGLFD